MEIYDIIVKNESGNLYSDKGETMGYYEGPYLENFISLVLDAPNIPDGKHRAYVQYQNLRKPETNTIWTDCHEDDLDFLSEFGDSFRRVWKLVKIKTYESK